ncbi:hypothetical protein H5089_09745 [Pseudoalteromonas sp. SR45-1]|uniref:hypothetical protein n=1 Tax=Pseudoalteromonas sp. SR45-1 TaxID=2760932 RepID=UPI0016036359|nr:hypothetical protein [Pseudoalteromonas sp. SR45-1]MBB1325789.1 hypothetical protein [Pseudoalteromonas sp. SR45-1]
MRIKKLILSLTKNIYYFLVNRLSNVVRRQPDNNSKFLVSLTTYNRRINRVYLTIESLFNQDEPASKVVLFLCEEDIPTKGMPRSLIRLEARGLEIKVVEKNIRSYKKLSCINMIEDYEDYNFVVTVDDDIFYPKNFLSGFSNNIKERNDEVLCYRGKTISFDSDNKILDYSKWPLSNNLSDWILPTGVSGVCYPIKILNEHFFDQEAFLTYCPTADDIWYKLCCLEQGVASRLVSEESIHFVPVFYFNADSLESINVGDNKNTIQIEKGLKYFNIPFER